MGVYRFGDAGHVEGIRDDRLMARIRLPGTWEEIQAAVESGRAQLHRFSGGFAITDIREYSNPHERVLNVLLLSGRDFEGWKVEADEGLCRYARVNGCQAIEFACRRGLMKKVAEMGYREHRTLARKELDEQKVLAAV